MSDAVEQKAGHHESKRLDFPLQELDWSSLTEKMEQYDETNQLI